MARAQAHLIHALGECGVQQTETEAGQRQRRQCAAEYAA